MAVMLMFVCCVYQEIMIPKEHACSFFPLSMSPLSSMSHDFDVRLADTFWRGTFLDDPVCREVFLSYPGINIMTGMLLVRI